MKLGNIEICYIPYNKSYYRIAKEEMAKLTINEVHSIVFGSSLIALNMLNTTFAKIDIENFSYKVNQKGNEILELVQVVGYWVAIAYAGIDIIKALKKQDIAGLMAILFKYAISVGLLYGVTDIFDIFRDLFK